MSNVWSYDKASICLLVNLREKKIRFRVGGNYEQKKKLSK